jgi:hypothetical protein
MAGCMEMKRITHHHSFQLCWGECSLLDTVIDTLFTIQFVVPIVFESCE